MPIFDVVVVVVIVVTVVVVVVVVVIPRFLPIPRKGFCGYDDRETDRDVSEKVNKQEFITPSLTGFRHQMRYSDLLAYLSLNCFLIDIVVSCF